MNYSMIKINGTSYGEMNTTQTQTMLTCDQLNLMINEINLQKQGYGVAPKYDKSLSPEENASGYNEYFQNYWFNTPGQDVPRKK